MTAPPAAASTINRGLVIPTRSLAVLALLSCGFVESIHGQTYEASPGGFARGADSVIEMQIDAAGRRAYVRKVSGTFQKPGLMRLYEQGSSYAAQSYWVGAAEVTFSLSFGFTSGSRSYYAVAESSDGNRFQSGVVQVTAVQQAPSAPLASVTPGSGAATITWNSVYGASRYKVTNLTIGQETDNLYSTSYTWP